MTPWTLFWTIVAGGAGLAVALVFLAAVVFSGYVGWVIAVRRLITWSRTPAPDPRSNPVPSGFLTIVRRAFRSRKAA